MKEFIDNPSYPSLRLSEISKLLIPLPPLEEQRRIVERIEELMSRIREAKRLRQEAKEETERLWQSVLVQTFPRLGSELPEGWRWVRLGEVCTLVESGFAFRKKGASQGDLLHLRPYNIAEDGTLDLSQRFYVPSSLRSVRYKLLQSDDVLFNNTNSVELVGKTALVREPLEAAFSNHITLLRSDTTKAFLISCFEVPKAFAIWAKLLSSTFPFPLLIYCTSILPPLQTKSKRYNAELEARRTVEDNEPLICLAFLPSLLLAIQLACCLNSMLSLFRHPIKLLPRRVA